MTNALKSISGGIDSLNERIGQWVSWFNLLLVLLVCMDVLLRYVFKYSAAWIGELEWHLFDIVFLVGAGYVYKHDRHIRVDLFYAKFSARNTAFTNLVGDLFFLVPWSIFIIYYSFKFAMGSFAIMEKSPEPGGLPYLFPIKFVIPIGFSLLFLQAISSLSKSIIELWGKKD